MGRDQCLQSSILYDNWGGRIHLNEPLWIDRWVETNVSSPVFSVITGGGRIHLNGPLWIDRWVETNVYGPVFSMITGVAVFTSMSHYG